jgi:hypothetical protein
MLFSVKIATKVMRHKGEPQVYDFNTMNVTAQVWATSGGFQPGDQDG